MTRQKEARSNGRGITSGMTTSNGTNQKSYYSVTIELVTTGCSTRGTERNGRRQQQRRQVVRKLLRPGVSAGRLVQECLERQSQWLVAVIRSIPEIQSQTSDCCLVQCGAGCDILVLLNDASFPSNVSRVPKIRVGLTRNFATVGRSSTRRAWICPRDSVFVFMRVAAKNGDNDRFYLEIDSNPSHSYQPVGDKHVVRIQLSKENIDHNTSIDIMKDIIGIQLEEYESGQFDC